MWSVRSSDSLAMMSPATSARKSEVMIAIVSAVTCVADGEARVHAVGELGRHAPVVAVEGLVERRHAVEDHEHDLEEQAHPEPEVRARARPELADLPAELAHERPDDRHATVTAARRGGVRAGRRRRERAEVAILRRAADRLDRADAHAAPRRAPRPRRRRRTPRASVTTPSAPSRAPERRQHRRCPLPIVELEPHRDRAVVELGPAAREDEAPVAEDRDPIGDLVPPPTGWCEDTTTVMPSSRLRRMTSARRSRMPSGSSPVSHSSSEQDVGSRQERLRERQPRRMP